MLDTSDMIKKTTFTWRGKTYVLPRQNFATEAALKEFLDRELFASVARKADMLPGKLYSEFIREALHMAGPGRAYRWASGSYWEEAMQAPEAAIYFFWLLLGQPEMDGKPSPNEPLSLAKVEEMWGEIGPEMREAWERLRMPPDPTAPAKGEPAPAA